MVLTLEYFLTVAAALFGLGLYVALSKRNAIGVLMGVELMLNSVNLTFVSFARFTETEEPLAGHVFALFVITVAAAEAAVALALAVLIYRIRRTINVDELNLMKW